MPVVLLLAALAILAGVVAVAIGRGGELAMFRPDTQAQQAVLATASDVAAFRPPLAFFGYSAPATDEALQRITAVVAERDAEVAWLRDEVHRLGGEPEDWAAGPDQPEAVSWPRGWTYAAQERRADPADWPAHGIDAEPEAEPEVQAADLPEPGWSDSGWSDSAADSTATNSTATSSMGADSAGAGGIGAEQP
jgi:hypothetical protein